MTDKLPKQFLSTWESSPASRLHMTWFHQHKKRISWPKGIQTKAVIFSVTPPPLSKSPPRSPSPSSLKQAPREQFIPYEPYLWRRICAFSRAGVVLLSSDEVAWRGGEDSQNWLIACQIFDGWMVGAIDPGDWLGLRRAHVDAMLLGSSIRILLQEKQWGALVPVGTHESYHVSVTISFSLFCLAVLLIDCDIVKREQSSTLLSEEGIG